LAGIYEQFERANFFFKLGIETVDTVARHRFFLATIYCCRAITEIMLDAAKEQELPDFRDLDIQLGRKKFEAHIQPLVAHYSLIEKIRIHDFHRFGIPPADPELNQTMVGGPIKLKGQRGVAAVVIRDSGFEEIATGNSQIELQRPFIRQNDCYFDEVTSEFVTLETILRSFLSSVPVIIGTFEKYSGKADAAQ
jgi:hypothetical protein